MDFHHNSLSLSLFMTAEYPCSYLPGRLARNLVADPLLVDNVVYNQLAKMGFRRSGDHVYRPHCIDCDECLSLRVPVAAFQPNRSQQRTWKKNRDLAARCVEPRFKWEQYQLFERYLKTRHSGGGMDSTTPESYLSFIAAHWSDTLLYEFRLRRRLLAVATVDRLNDGLSAVYTFFDPDEAARSLGTYTILWEIAEAARCGLQWLYLGYWVRDCGKMAYKTNFRPHQLFVKGQWTPGTE